MGPRGGYVRTENLPILQDFVPYQPKKRERKRERDRKRESEREREREREKEKENTRRASRKKDQALWRMDDKERGKC